MPHVQNSPAPPRLETPPCLSTHLQNKTPQLVPPPPPFNHFLSTPFLPGLPFAPIPVSQLLLLGSHRGVPETNSGGISLSLSYLMSWQYLTYCPHSSLSPVSLAAVPRHPAETSPFHAPLILGRLSHLASPHPFPVILSTVNGSSNAGCRLAVPKS